MKEINRSLTDPEALLHKHPVRQQFMAVLLGICLAVVSIPVSSFGGAVQAAGMQQGEMEREDIVTGDEGREVYGLTEEEMLISESVEEVFDTEEGTETETDLTPVTPDCGRVSRNVTWDMDGTLADGELIVDPGVVLTIRGTINISGRVVIYGGGTIERETGGFSLGNGNSLTLRDITLDGKMSASKNPIISMRSGNTLTMEAGCTVRNGLASHGGGVFSEGTRNTVTMNGALIENCKATGAFSPRGGAIFFNPTGSVQEGSRNTIILNQATIRNCTAQDVAGGVYAKYTNVTINGGNYENNKVLASDNDFAGGGFMFNCQGTLTINDGNFIGNSAATKGGCIEHCGHENTRTYINGGRFIGNICSNEKYKGSGAIYNSTVEIENTSITLSGDAMFGDGGEKDGTDGIYLDSRENIARKVWISDTLTYPVTLYLVPEENYVIAEGTNQYQLLKRRDMKKIHFADLTDSGKTWYAKLDEAKNQVRLTQTSPGYGYFVYYIKNGGKGTAPTDDTEYEAGDEVTVKSAEGLSRDGYVFTGWNTEADGSGAMYLAEGENNTFILEKDTDLYAIFKKQLKADFYSGSAGNKETVPAIMNIGGTGGKVTAPELEPMAGFEPIGWETQEDGYDGLTEPGTELALEDDAVYYGVYGREVTLSYDANGGLDSPDSETKLCRANVHEEISYDIPEFTIADAIQRSGYAFAGWNTKADGTGEPYDAGGSFETDEDLTLYAMWVEGDETPYRIEHYLQDAEGDGYTRADADTEYLSGKTGSEVAAEAKSYAGFTENTETGLRKESGRIEADGSLVLQLYYDRNLYEVDFNLNGGEGEAPAMQSVRYGACLQETPAPLRRGYTFKGWYKDEAGTDDAFWDFIQTVEKNTQKVHTTLYAKWADETAPAIGEASFGTGYRNFMDWVISGKKLIITVPVTEEGSGLKQADYCLEPENGEKKEGQAKIRTGGGLIPMLRARSGGIGAVMTLYGDAGSGRYETEIVIEEDFKGKISLTCTDNAGNISLEKRLTADGAGAVVEDYAPEIAFSDVEEDKKRETARVTVDVTDAAGENVTAGLASVTYKIDKGEEQAEGAEEFATAMVEDYRFEVTVKGAGEHTLLVTAEDNAGNVSTEETKIKINKEKPVVSGDDPEPKPPVKQDPKPSGPKEPKPPVKQDPKPPVKQEPKPAGALPGTGDRTPVKVFATLAMVAGFTYLLVYFTSGDNGITEKEKDEIISRLVRWARKGRFRKYPALAAISLFLMYYHSIGKSVNDEWKRLYES